VERPGALSFCSAVGERAVTMIRDARAAVVICASGPHVAALADTGVTLLEVENPRLAFLRVVERLFAAPRPVGVHPTAIVDPSASLGRDVYLGPGVWIGPDCEVGDDSVLWGNVQCYARTRIGRRVTIHAGTVIGADGFGYERNEAKELEKFPHVGGVVIEDDVEIGANTCIDRGTLADTIVRQGARIDNLVHIAHNVVVGRHAAVIAHAMIGGSTTIGDYAWVAPCACVRDGIALGDRSLVGLGAVVVKSVPDDAIVMGSPARPAAEYKALLHQLAKMGEDS
jgi:UDP-3-O-[3-hydroxymyristoyl] glucosamine N-acyltransferase